MAIDRRLLGTPLSMPVFHNSSGFSLGFNIPAGWIDEKIWIRAERLLGDYHGSVPIPSTDELERAGVACADYYAASQNGIKIGAIVGVISALAVSVALGTNSNEVGVPYFSYLCLSSLLSCVLAPIGAMLGRRLAPPPRLLEHPARVYARQFAAFLKRRAAEMERIEQQKEEDRKSRYFWKSLTWRELEFEVARLFCKAKMNAEVTPGSNDRGIDVQVNTESVTIIVQCKQYSKPVGRNIVSELIGVLYCSDADLAVLVCTGGFLPGAEELAAEQNILLWSLDELVAFQSVPEDIPRALGLN